MLDGVPLSLPALVRASKLGKRAARVGFDWPDADGARRKVDEELAELDQELARPRVSASTRRSTRNSATCCSRSSAGRGCSGRDPERILRAANRKFERRFAAMEQLAAARGQNLASLSAEAWDALWEGVKKASRAFSPDSSPAPQAGLRSLENRS